MVCLQAKQYSVWELRFLPGDPTAPAFFGEQQLTQYISSRARRFFLLSTQHHHTTVRRAFACSRCIPLTLLEMLLPIKEEEEEEEQHNQGLASSAFEAYKPNKKYAGLASRAWGLEAYQGKKKLLKLLNVSDLRPSASGTVLITKCRKRKPLLAPRASPASWV